MFNALIPERPLFRAGKSSGEVFAGGFELVRIGLDKLRDAVGETVFRTVYEIVLNTSEVTTSPTPTTAPDSSPDSRSPACKRLNGIFLLGPSPQDGAMKKVFGLLSLLVVTPVLAQDFNAGLNGWKLERLSNEFVLLRTSIETSEQGTSRHSQGLLILTCEQNVRRIRFHISDLPRSPSTRPSYLGRAIVRGVLRPQPDQSSTIYPQVGFFDDGSFEFREAAGFGDSTMRLFLNLLEKAPSQIEVVLFKGSETRAFTRGMPMRFRLHGLEENLGNIYGFEGLCFRAKD